MPFLAGAGASPFFGTCFRPTVFFCAAGVRSVESGVAAACVALETGAGEVSSGKVVLHVMSLENEEVQSSRMLIKG